MVLSREGKSSRTLRFRLGELTVHTMFEAETVGVLLALHLLRCTPNVRRGTIHLDNQAVIESLHIHKPRPVQYLTDEIIHQVDSIWQRATHPSFRLEILWVRGHSDSMGNERVDQEAKKASKGTTSKESLLPCFLTECESLPQSMTAIWQAYVTQVTQMWSDNWRSSPHYPKLDKIDPKMLSKGFRVLTTELSRAQTSLLVQLRTGHLLLNSYLHRILKVSSLQCPSCHEAPETDHMPFHHRLSLLAL